jgi:hypothetical protein
MRLTSALILAAVLVAFATSSAHGDAPRVAEELKAYYADRNRQPPWEDAVERLGSDDAGRRDAAAAYLRDLLDQAQKDELSGASPWRATPFWGNPAENPARELRQYVATALAKAPAAPAAVPVVRWFLDHEKVPPFQETALAALTKAEGREADDLLLELASKPHPNAAVVVASLREVTRRQLPIKAEALAALGRHYRPSIREAAAATAERLGLPKPPPFDKASAVQTEPFRRLMDDIGRLLLDAPPPDARFVKMTRRFSDGDEWSELGWLVSEDEERWAVLTVQGRPERYSKKEGHRWTTRMAEAPLRGWVDQVVAARAAGNKDFELSERGGLTGQFQGHAATLAEVLLAQRLYVAKEYGLAAEVLLPALDTLPLDEQLVEMARDRLGVVYGHAMLGSFAGDRDYDETLRVARHITERLSRARFHAEAARLLDELPRRRDDYKQFRLPTPEEWAAEKKRLSRAEQIDYLCRRLRLLNCYQHGQPGGISFTDRQYAEPTSAGGDRTEVINPYVELVGNKGNRRGDEATSGGLGLTGADIPLLAEHLRDDWYMPSVSYWRDFHPQRKLHRTRELVAALINEAAMADLCDERKLDAMTAEELDREIEHLKRWGELGSVTGKAKVLLNLGAAFAVLVTLAGLTRRAIRSFRSHGLKGPPTAPQ